MRTFGKNLVRLLLLLIMVGSGLWYFGPYERISLISTFDNSKIGENLDVYLDNSEAHYNDITPGTQKRVIWHQTPGQKTALSIVYVHGFSATSQEACPVPELVAEKLGANLIFTRLKGHGRPGSALAEATVQDWMNDLAEALEIGRRSGDKVVVIAMSTGATLIAEAAMQQGFLEGISGAVLISPNFRIADPAAALLTMPAARYWAPIVAGKQRNWQGQNPEHAKYWTTTYPTTALFQMAALVQHAAALDYSATILPVLFWFSDQDSVVDHTVTRQISALWGGPVSKEIVTVGDTDDPNNHNIAGEILSPGQTEKVVEGIISWINELK